MANIFQIVPFIIWMSLQYLVLSCFHTITAILQMYKFRVSGNILLVAQLPYCFCYYTMVGNPQKTCRICLKTMRSDNLKRHMKRHEKKPYPIYEAETVIKTYRSGTSLGKCTSLNLEELEKNVIAEVNEFKRKI